LFESEMSLSPTPNQSNFVNHYLCNQYEIFLDNSYLRILSFLIECNLPTPIYMTSSFVSFCDPLQIKLSSSAQRLLFEENAGGCSEFSEAFSFELGNVFLRSCARLRWPFYIGRITAKRLII